MYAYGVEKSIATILTEKDDQKEEHHIAFHIQTLHKHQVRYSFIEKQVFSTMRCLKKFKHYVSQNKILVYTIHPDIMNYIIQGELSEGTVGWITRIMEYDVEIKPTNIIKERALYYNIAEVMHIINFIEDEEHLNEESDWIKQYIVYFRTGLYPKSFDRFQRRRFKLQTLKFIMIDDHLYRRTFDQNLLICVTYDDA